MEGRAARTYRRCCLAVCAVFTAALVSGCSSAYLDDAKLAAQDAFASISNVEDDQDKQTSVLITVQNNPLFQQALQAPSPQDSSITNFVSQYRGRTVEFDATVSQVSEDLSAPGERTLNDIQLVAGDEAQWQAGPVFTLSGINVSKTGLSSLDQGLKVDLIATVDSYDEASGQLNLGLVSINERS